MLLEKALWRTYLLILLGTILSAGVMLYLKWQEIQESAYANLAQTNLVVKNATHSFFKNQETVLTVLGNRLLDIGGLTGAAPAKKLLIQEVAKNSALADCGIADLEGKMVLNLLNTELQNHNLQSSTESAKLFRQAMNSDSMVLGRAQYIEAIKQWVIPAMLRLKDRNDQVIAIMVVSLTINSQYSP